MAKVKLNDWLDYLKSRVNIDLYVWGANGQLLVDILNNLREMEKNENDLDRTLTLLQKRLRANVNIYDICCEDCSGLGVKFLLPRKLIPYDMTANGLYGYIVGTKEIAPHGKSISLSKVKAGDYLFKGSDSNKTHIGYAIDSEWAVESQDHDVGVVKTRISDRPWKYAARPNWYSDSPDPEPTKPILTRELYYKKTSDGYIVIRGDDVKEAQVLLTEQGYNCGELDGIFGNNTSIATRNFQHDNNLTEDGVIGKNTGTMLGFEWKG